MATQEKSQRVSRLLEMVTLFQSGSGWTARALGERFGVSETRVFHDVRALRAAGIPVQRSRAGYRIAPSFFMPSVQLTPHEVLALLFPVEVFTGAIASEEVQHSARAKLLSCLPPALRAWAEELAAHSDVALPAAGLNREVFASVSAAVAERRRIAIIYSGRTAEALRRLEVDPYAVVFRKHAWYLVAFSVTHKEVRKFRVSRIGAVETTPLRFSAPKDFSLERYFDGVWYVFGGKPQEVGIRLGPRAARLVRERKPHPGQTIQGFSDGSAFYRARVANLEELAWWLVQFGDQVTVAYPPALRDLVLELARGVLRAHGIPAARGPQPYAAACQVPAHLIAEPGGETPPAGRS